MLILGIETATPQVGCALGAHEGVLASFHAAKGRRHAETLAPAIEFICRQARVDLDDVGAVAADVGPGLFTGLRVGVVTAKALAMALRVPVVGVSSLDLLAFPVRWSHRRIVSVVDARRGEVFYGFYRQVPGGVQRVSEHRVASPEELCSEILASGEDCLAVGDGALRYADRLAELIQVEVAEAGLAYPSAASLVQLAHARAVREDFVNSWELAPVYLRKADAEIDWRDRIRVRPGADPEP
ncbi:MAG TPA: tRNA (adenosine(37)-N6)-threonylcarbamoyltransferase complex dimerization subunit type 1 TsaB [Acidimicrobiales bacterium]|nr:tRNA (adenosine(37)-N6)-threonylcarbamoyltransferase complex dimerization subunit type 1 TsaB [Acidimicrobiales bacterium]